MTTAELLERGAQYIRDHGHTKGTLWDDHGRVCLRGAMLSVCENIARRDEYKAFRAMEFESPNDRSPEDAIERAVMWNNDPDRTAEEVIARMETAAGILRAQEFANTPQPELEPALAVK